MSYREFHYRWEYDLKSTSEQLWPFVADTNRFNRDTGLPAINPADDQTKSKGLRRRLRLSIFGMDVEWDEQPFEWQQPSRFGITRKYFKGPLAELSVLVELSDKPEGGAKLVYQIWATPSSLLGRLIIPFQIGIQSSRRFAKAYRKYDEWASAGDFTEAEELAVDIAPAARRRLDQLRDRLIEQGVSKKIAKGLERFIEVADDMDVTRIRPYALADSWHEPRRAVLEACFRATRIGMLDLQWDLLCPMCRGPQESSSSLRDVHSNVHCEGCQIDFTVSFDRFVEVTFKPNVSIRHIEVANYCMGSPQRTPHVVAQQLLAPMSERIVTLPLEEGRYRIRAVGLPGEQLVKVDAGGRSNAEAVGAAAGWSSEELSLASNSSIRLGNASESEQLFLIERMAWSDQAATAAEVTALQIFRDLFSTEALRAGEQISVGTLTVLFTDLRNSTRMYREIGDATAFGRVMNHFDVLKQAIADEDGALVKTIGDAVMAVFREPEAALRAMLKAQQVLASPPDGSEPLTLKAGMHLGPCIAVTLNDRLDYFGSTVNMAARLEALSNGSDVVISRAVYDDPEVRELISDPSSGISAESFEMLLKGFDEERFELWRISRGAATHAMVQAN